MILSANVIPFEFVSPDFAAWVDCGRPVDFESARKGVVLRDAAVRVRLTEGGRRVHVRALEPLAPGRYALEVGPLVDPDGRPLGPPRSIPFFVAATAARVPGAFRVGNFTRLARRGLEVQRLSPFERADGEFVDVLKVTHRVTGARRVLAFDPSGLPTDPDALLRSVLEARAARYGKVQPALFERMEREPGLVFEVALWLSHDAHPAAREKSPYAESVRPGEAALARQDRLAVTREAFVARARAGGPAALGVEVTAASARAPVVYATATREAILRAAADPAVAAVFGVDRTMVLDLDQAVQDANADDAHGAEVTGKGVKVAVFESGPDDVTALHITGQYVADPVTSDHARLTHAVVRNEQTSGSRGFAPECELYSANAKGLDALDWAVAKGCTVINQSFHRAEEATAHELTFDDVYKDWLVLEWPYPTIVQAAGNLVDGDDVTPPVAEYVNHKGYNTLAVGCHEDGAAVAWEYSAFRNPSSLHGDRELPELCANGTSVTAVGLTKYGTSFAAPAVAGCAALIQSVDAVLKSWPEGCRAVLLAGAWRNLSGSTWWGDVHAQVDGHDGSGAVDAMAAVEIARARSGRDRAGAQRGWDVGALTAGDFDKSTGRSTFVYRVEVPRKSGGPRHVKVALAWSSAIRELEVAGATGSHTSTLTADHDLLVYDASGELVASSESWDNSYEIAEFDGAGGATYTVRVARASGGDAVRYGIAWTVA